MHPIEIRLLLCCVGWCNSEERKSPRPISRTLGNSHRNNPDLKIAPEDIIKCFLKGSLHVGKQGEDYAGFRGVSMCFYLTLSGKEKAREGEPQVTSSVRETGGFRQCDGLVSGPY